MEMIGASSIIFCIGAGLVGLLGIGIFLLFRTAGNQSSGDSQSHYNSDSGGFLSWGGSSDSINNDGDNDGDFWGGDSTSDGGDSGGDGGGGDSGGGE